MCESARLKALNEREKESLHVEFGEDVNNFRKLYLTSSISSKITNRAYKRIFKLYNDNLSIFDTFIDSSARTCM